MSRNYTNAAASTLSGSQTNVATTLTVTSASSFPSAGNFNVLVDSGANAELMQVTGISGTTFTVTRAVESYPGGASVGTGVAHSAGVAITLVMTAADLMAFGAYPTTVNAISTTASTVTNDVNRCTATSANYTVTVTDGSANTDMVTIAVTDASTKFVTISGKLRQSTTATRVMWGGESFTFRWNTTLGGWEVVNSVIKPMIARMGLSADQGSITNTTVTKVNLDRSDIDNTSAMVDAATNHQITVKRDGTYKIIGKVTWSGASTVGANTRLISQVYKTSTAGTQIASGEMSGGTSAGNSSTPTGVDIVSLVATDVVLLACYQSSGGTVSVYGAAGNGSCSLVVEEVPIW